MNDAFQNDSPEFAKKRLTEACRTKDTSVRLAWAITIGEAILLGVFAVALMDYWLMLPVWMRSSAAGVVALLAAFGIYRLVKFYRRPTPLKEAALDLEMQRPEFGCEISTAAEYLSGERKATHEYEPELVAALESRAAEELRAAQIPYERKMLRPVLVLLVTLLALVIFVVAAPVAFTALTRAALPFSKAHYTQVEVKPGNIEMPAGRDLEITNVFSGRIPKDPKFHWLEAGSQTWQTIALTKSTNGTYNYTFKDLQADVTYRVTGNDAVSDDYRITTYVPPEVKDLTVRIEHPDYTQLKPAIQRSPEITALRASTVQIRIEPNVALSKAKLRFSSAAEELPLQPGPDGSWSGSLKVTKDTDYWIELADAKGRSGANQKPYHIKALPDAPPKVEIADPGQDTRAAVTNRVPVRISVTDDFGVGDIEVVFHKISGAEQTIAAKRESSENGEITASADLDLSSLGLNDYELVAYHAQAKDNNPIDGPGLGKSPVYFIEITNLEAGECKPRVPGQAVNLLVIQKQIIADTHALSPNAAPEKFTELAAREKDTTDFANIYLETLNATGAPPEAVTAMQSAVADMEKAGGHLGARNRAEALPPEESALANLYQVLKLMPELKDMPTEPKPQDQQPPPNDRLAVVLQAIKEKKKEQPENKEIEAALEEAQQLAQAQAALNTVMRKQAQAAGKGQGQGQGEKASQQDAQNQKDSEPDQKDPQGKDQAKKELLAKAGKNEGKGQSQGQGEGEGKGKGKGKGQGQGEGQGEGEGKGKGQAQKQGQGKGQGKGQAQGQGDGQGENQQGQQENEPIEQTEPAEPEDATELAQQEGELSKEAQELAAKLQRLSGNDKRVGHNAGKNAKLAGQKLATATEEIKQGNFGAAGVNGFHGELALREVIAQLERILREQPELTDVTDEDFPKEYEGLIAEYFKKLSHAE